MFNPMSKPWEVTSYLREKYGQDNIITIQSKPPRHYTVHLRDGRVVEAGVANDGTIRCLEFGGC